MFKKHRLLITGSREWDDYDTIKSTIIELLGEIIEDNPHLRGVPIKAWFNILHGDCPKGADYLANLFAVKELKVAPEKYAADWRIGKKAGFVRNSRMVDTMPDYCYAYIRNKSKGATMCRNLAKQRGIPTETFKYEDYHD